MIAYDLPYHGKSLPPEGNEWWAEEYRLTEDFLMKVPVTLARDARISTDRSSWEVPSAATSRSTLRSTTRSSFRAVIGLEAALSTPGGYSTTSGTTRASATTSRPASCTG